MASSDTRERGLAPRVSVLETNVESVKADVGTLRNETREGFAGVRAALDRIGERLAASDTARLTYEAGRPRSTNWYAVIGFVVAAVTIMGAIFSLAEWRVSTAFDPLKEIVREHRHELRETREKHLQLRIELEREKAIRDAQRGKL